MSAVEITGLAREYETGGGVVRAVADVSLSVDRGEFVSVLGPGGSGKTTLLCLVGLLDSPTRGEVRLDGEVVTGLGEPRRTDLRRRRVGLVFRQPSLLPGLTAVENVELPAVGHSERTRARAATLLDRVGLGDCQAERPAALSAGRRQRVAVARALVNDPAVLLADDPTARLDREAGRRVLEAVEAATDRGVAVLLATHDPAVADRADRTLEFVDGRVEA